VHAGRRSGCIQRRACAFAAACVLVSAPRGQNRAAGRPHLIVGVRECYLSPRGLRVPFCRWALHQLQAVDEAAAGTGDMPNAKGPSVDSSGSSSQQDQQQQQQQQEQEQEQEQQQEQQQQEQEHEKAGEENQQQRNKTEEQQKQQQQRRRQQQQVPWWVRALAVVEPREASDYASVGTSAGVAVAFNGPVAGVAYAAEEGNTVYSVSMLWKVGGVSGCELEGRVAVDQGARGKGHQRSLSLNSRALSESEQPILLSFSLPPRPCLQLGAPSWSCSSAATQKSTGLAWALRASSSAITCRSGVLLPCGAYSGEAGALRFV